MRTSVILLLAAFLVGADDTAPRVITFGKDAVDKLPAGWKADKSGKGEGSVWKVLADKTAPSKSGQVLAQTAAGTRPVFNLCVLEDSQVSKRRSQSCLQGRRGQDRPGGRRRLAYLDSSNYYLARMNPLEDNFRVYKIVAGERIQLATSPAWRSRPATGTPSKFATRATRSSATSTTSNSWTPPTIPSPNPARSASGPRPTPRPTSITSASISRLLMFGSGESS